MPINGWHLYSSHFEQISILPMPNIHKRSLLQFCSCFITCPSESIANTTKSLVLGPVFVCSEHLPFAVLTSAKTSDLFLFIRDAVWSHIPLVHASVDACWQLSVRSLDGCATTCHLLDFTAVIFLISAVCSHWRHHTSLSIPWWCNHVSKDNCSRVYSSGVGWPAQQHRRILVLVSCQPSPRASMRHLCLKPASGVGSCLWQFAYLHRHDFLDTLWWIEMALMCDASFYIIIKDLQKLLKINT